MMGSYGMLTDNSEIQLVCAEGGRLITIPFFHLYSKKTNTP